MEKENIADVLSVLGGNKDFKVSVDKESIAIIGLVMTISIFIGVFVANKLSR